MKLVRSILSYGKWWRKEKKRKKQEKSQSLSRWPEMLTQSFLSGDDIPKSLNDLKTKSFLGEENWGWKPPACVDFFGYVNANPKDFWMCLTLWQDICTMKQRTGREWINRFQWSYTTFFTLTFWGEKRKQFASLISWFWSESECIFHNEWRQSLTIWVKIF